MTHYGYARVSTEGQDHSHQLDALMREGVLPENIRVEVGSGGDTTRPVLTQLMLEMQEGDRLTVYALDRLARDSRHAIDLMASMVQRGIVFDTATLAIDPTTPEGRCVANIITALDQLQRERLSERTKAGLQAARERGVRLGAPRATTATQRRMIRRMAEGDEPSPDGRPWSLRRIAAEVGVSASTVRRVLHDPEP